MNERLIERLLRKAAKKYYEGTTIISNAEYDWRREELAGLNPENPFLSEVGPRPPLVDFSSK